MRRGLAMLTIRNMQCYSFLSIVTCGFDGFICRQPGSGDRSETSMTSCRHSKCSSSLPPAASLQRTRRIPLPGAVTRQTGRRFHLRTLPVLRNVAPSEIAVSCRHHCAHIASCSSLPSMSSAGIRIYLHMGNQKARCAVRACL